jgi:ribose 5-phosphate isomerase B
VRILFGADNNGLPLMNVLANYVRDKLPDVILAIAPLELTADYPEIAFSVAKRVSAGEFDRGVLCCGTGAGMAIVANKVRGVRAVCLADRLTAERAITSNDARIASFGNDVISPEFAVELLSIWLNHEFRGGASSRKVARIIDIENEKSEATSGINVGETPE